MQYFLIPGRHPALSAAEAWAVAEREGVAARFSAAAGAILMSTDRDIPAELPGWLGGMVKFGEIIGEAGRDELAERLAVIVGSAGARDFGVSVYGASGRKNPGLDVKRILKERGAASRWVSSREPTLSAVVVQRNKLLGPGIELCVFIDGDRCLIGRTTAVQAFDEFSFRDYGRPRRDIRSGMLPVKLARMLINLSRTPRAGVLLDPFCGSGTILTEAAILGFREVIGSDLEETAVADTSENLDWIRRHFDISQTSARVIRSPAQKLDVTLRGASVDGIATEPYLGPPLRGRETRKEILAIIGELSPLFVSAFESFRSIISPDARLAVVLPLFRSGRADLPLPILDDLAALGFTPTPLLPAGIGLAASPRGSIIYRRPDQRVAREVFVFSRRADVRRSPPVRSTR